MAADATSLDVDAGQVIQIMLQFMKENGLSSSMKVLQEETGVFLNTSEDSNLLRSRIISGQWDLVLKELGTLSIPPNKLAMLYEQVVLEMLELREMDTARAILRSSAPMVLMKRTEPQRFVRLENWLNRGHFDPDLAYEGETTKQSRREEVAAAIMEEIASVPPSRLLSMVGQAMKWQQHMGRLPRGTEFDLLRGVAPSKKDAEEAPATRKAGVVRFGSKTQAEAAAFSPDGRFLITGTVDGFVEVWNPSTCKLDKSIMTYQAADKFMMHDAAVQCIAFTQDSELLATGAQNGKIKVWRVSTGKCVRKFLRAHEDGVTSVAFSADCTQVLSASVDTTARVHGLRSGKKLKEFRGHESYVNSAVYSGTGSRVVTASSDGTIKVWDLASTDCIRTFRLPKPKSGMDPPIQSISVIPKHEEHLLVCNRSSCLYVVNEMGHILSKLSPPTEKEGPFVACVASPKGGLVYALREDKRVYCFKLSSAELLTVTPVTEAEPTTVLLHPHKNLLGTIATDHRVVLWKSRKHRRRK